METGVVLPEDADEDTVNRQDALLKAWEDGNEPMVSSYRGEFVGF